MIAPRGMRRARRAWDIDATSCFRGGEGGSRPSTDVAEGHINLLAFRHAARSRDLFYFVAHLSRWTRNTDWQDRPATRCKRGEYICRVYPLTATLAPRPSTWQERRMKNELERYRVTNSWHPPVTRNTKALPIPLRSTRTRFGLAECSTTTTLSRSPPITNSSNA